MAFDKVVDSGKLFGAMEATADALRNKSGINDFIYWNETTGFANFINEMPNGASDFKMAGRKIEYGTLKRLDADGPIVITHGLGLVSGVIIGHKELYVDSNTMLIYIAVKTNSNNDSFYYMNSEYGLMFGNDDMIAFEDEMAGYVHIYEKQHLYAEELDYILIGQEPMEPPK